MKRPTLNYLLAGMASTVILVSFACNEAPTVPSTPIVITTPAPGTKFLQGRDTITVNFSPANTGIRVLFSYNLDTPPVYDTLTDIISQTATSVKFITPFSERFYSDSATIRIEDKTGSNTPGFSSAFAVKQMVLTSPVDGSIHMAGQPIYVKWAVATGAPISGIEIAYSTDGGIDWTVVGSGSVYEFDSLGALNPKWQNYPILINQPFPEVMVRIRDYFARSKADWNVTPIKVQ